jgi:hypothetical protein
LVAGDLAKHRGATCIRNYFLFFIFIFILFYFLSQATSRSAGGPPAPSRKKILKNKNKFFLFKFFIFPPSGLTPRTSVGLSHGSPPTSYLLTPTSYLYYYIRLLMSLISLFFFALTFGKPLNYFTCEIDEDF